MNEILIYITLSLLCLLLFFVWYKRQGVAAEKHWLLKQISQTAGQDQQSYLNALNQLTTHSANIKMTALIGFMVIPAAFVIDYLWFHEIPIDQRVSMADIQNTNDSNASGQNTNAQAPDLNTAIKQLEQKLIDDPNNLEGQLLYGRSMMKMQRFTEAVGAYRKANQLEPNNANILTELAEAIAFENNTGSFLGEPEKFLSQAIEIDPKLQKAMWLQGIVYYENLNYPAAETIWSDLLVQVESPSIRSTITQQINQARAAQNKPALDNDASADPIIATESGYFVVIDASEDIKAMTLNPAARLFVYAKQVNGPPMPIAAAPISQPFNWPISIQLSDANSLNPARKLSDFDEIEFSAKLSLTGSATPDVGDIKSELKTTQQQDKNITLTLTK